MLSVVEAWLNERMTIYKAKPTLVGIYILSTMPEPEVLFTLSEITLKPESEFWYLQIDGLFRIGVRASVLGERKKIENSLNFWKWTPFYLKDQ
jgi:hypothetical protein